MVLAMMSEFFIETWHFACYVKRHRVLFKARAVAGFLCPCFCMGKGGCIVCGRVGYESRFLVDSLLTPEKERDVVLLLPGGLH